MGVRINETVFVSEEGITRLLIENDMCEILPNSDVDCSPTVPAFCGDETDPEDNKIDWRLGDMIFPEQNVLVEYNADDRVIIIS
ncbi:MAG: hypothetical protein KKF44_01995, partial [Nanoarchaeota archaeon]|nr:hypothetical protein [Nanoarchaeota archaeon]